MVAADFVEVDNRVWPFLEAAQQYHQSTAFSSLTVYDVYVYWTVWAEHVFAAFSA